MRSFQVLSVATLVATFAIFTAEAQLRSSFVEDSLDRRLSTYGGTEDKDEYDMGGKGGMMGGKGGMSVLSMLIGVIVSIMAIVLTVDLLICIRFCCYFHLLR